MPSKPWMNPDQLAWFTEHRPEFLDAQKMRNKEVALDKFFVSIENEWFDKWPELEVLFGPGVVKEDLTGEQVTILGNAVKARQKVFIYFFRIDASPLTLYYQQLRSKFYNSTAKGRSAAKVPSSGLIGFGGGKSSRRVAQVTELYIKRYYKEKIKPVVDVEMSKLEVKKGKSIQVIRRVVQELFDRESEDIKAAMLCEAETMKNAVPENGDTSVGAKSPQDYQRCAYASSIT